MKVEQVNEPHDYQQLHQKFADSEYGRKLAGQPRFDRYRPEHISAGEWIEMLGPDVDNLEHHQFTYNIAEEFITRSNGMLTGDEEHLLKLAAISHDWNEAIVTDINFEFKTSQDVADERLAQAVVFYEINGLDGETYSRIEAILYDDSSRLGHIFNLIERIGYMSTALSAFKVSQVTDDRTLAEELRRLCGSVVSHNHDYLLAQASEYPYVEEFLTRSEATIRQIYKSLQPEHFTIIKPKV